MRLSAACSICLSALKGSSERSAATARAASKQAATASSVAARMWSGSGIAGMIPSPMSSSIHRARIPSDDRREASDGDRRTPRRSSGAAPTAADGMSRASSMPSWIQSMRTVSCAR